MYPVKGIPKLSINFSGFSKGSVVCNFKVNYVLKEGFVAIPFHVNATNVTETLGDGFNFKQGLLFQRFVIAAGSFKAASEFSVHLVT